MASTISSLTLQSFIELSKRLTSDELEQFHAQTYKTYKLRRFCMNYYIVTAQSNEEAIKKLSVSKEFREGQMTNASEEVKYMRFDGRYAYCIFCGNKNINPCSHKFSDITDEQWYELAKYDCTRKGKLIEITNPVCIKN